MHSVCFFFLWNRQNDFAVLLHMDSITTVHLKQEYEEEYEKQHN